MGKSVAAIICAAGRSRRFSGKRNKALVDVAGRAVFLRSIELFEERDDVKQIILAISPEDEELVRIKWGPNLSFFGVKTCLGGSERSDTVRNALDELHEDIDLVAVHDAARCCVTKELIQQLIKAASQHGAAIPACPVIPTLKQIKDNVIVKTVDRSDLYEAQTPQVFDRALLQRAYNNSDELGSGTIPISDDAQLVEAMGEDVFIVKSDPSNLKITYSVDSAIAEAILKARPKPTPDGPIGPYAGEAQW
jgi:2-C-methyl-D-erythritol 4-phosphate cytidylyltransferase